MAPGDPRPVIDDQLYCRLIWSPGACFEQLDKERGWPSDTLGGRSSCLQGSFWAQLDTLSESGRNTTRSSSVPLKYLPLRKQRPGTMKCGQVEVTKVVDKLLGGMASGVDEICPEYPSLSMLWGCLTCQAASHGGQGQYFWSGKLGWWYLLLKRTTGCVQTTGDHTSQLPWKGLRQGTWRGEFSR